MKHMRGGRLRRCPLSGRLRTVQIPLMRGLCTLLSPQKGRSRLVLDINRTQNTAEAKPHERRLTAKSYRSPDTENPADAGFLIGDYPLQYIPYVYDSFLNVRKASFFTVQCVPLLLPCYRSFKPACHHILLCYRSDRVDPRASPMKRQSSID